MNVKSLTQFCKYLSCFLIILYIYLPLRHARWYNYIKIDNILNEIELQQNTKSTNLTNLKKCPYGYIIEHNNEIPITSLFKIKHFESPLLGGEHIPKKCLSYKSAILVPYRNRRQQLDTFLNYMHFFLQNQYVSYRIFIIEQNNTLAFNRAKLLNVGALEAMKMNYSCLIMNDVDLLPLNTGNIYTCSKLPRHMCSSLDTFRYNLPYIGLFGGAISITTEQYEKVNGMSNEYVGWGGEDDDLYRRLTLYNITPYRFSPAVSKYTMLKHMKEKPSVYRFDKLKKSLERQQSDGLHSLSNEYVVNLKTLYTHITVN